MMTAWLLIMLALVAGLQLRRSPVRPPRGDVLMPVLLLLAAAGLASWGIETQRWTPTWF